MNGQKPDRQRRKLDLITNITVDHSAVIDGDPRSAWVPIAAFEDMRWHPQVHSSRLVSGESGQVDAVRELGLADGSTVHERSKNWTTPG
jgi:polyketide cyclase/dehydrase/lipid transport protein